jgi:hypothetical protein
VDGDPGESIPGRPLDEITTNMVVAANRELLRLVNERRRSGFTAARSSDVRH